ncbi:hypothetical protein [Branchiibius sp. NY16-3462-2]|uniref:hypothetical protein n=1 Tax=Branchiibius sp. NY16-3462-2 TaxID=1807500 RepID=UPI000799F1D9|nr:hypothetical protein [Branchiibius sp. NY16-3462-2]KYH45757.1 hypothetical protein AZH51_08665 [Branchiibius sp. NY16-3462-2]
MPVLDTLKIDAAPLYAVVGAGDLAAEKVREVADDLTARADKARADLAPAKLQTKVEELADQAGDLPTKLFGFVKSLPANAADQAANVTDAVTEGYEDLTARGEKLIERVRTQRATKELIDQAGSTLSQAKGAVTTAKDAAEQIERSAKATVTTGRHQAEKLLDVVISANEEEAEVIKAQAETAVKKTRTAAKRTATTTKRATKRTATATKGANTSARKTATSARKAAAATAKKVGD